MNYIYLKEINCLDIDDLKKEIYEIELIIKKKFSKTLDATNIKKYGNGSLSTQLSKWYNTFSFNKPQLSKLLHEIKTFFVESSNSTESYSISSWINIYKKGQFLKWHKHGDIISNEQPKAYHGYFCVQAEPSATLFKFPENPDITVTHNNINRCLI